MRVTIEVDSWHQAHHLGCVLADAEWAYNERSAKWSKDDEVRAGLKAYARFFRQVAKAVTTQAKDLNMP